MKKNLARRIYNYCGRRVESFIYTIGNSIRFRYHCDDSGINLTEKREKEIIVSLTSIPSRLDKIHLCIETLMRQTVKPDKIILYLGTNCQKQKLPVKLEKLTERGLTIEYREDLKPHTKYYYAMKEHAEAIVITVDDDIFYRRDLVEILIASYNKYPNAVSCFRAQKILFDCDGKLLPNKQWEQYCTSIKEPSYALVALGVEGVLYPPHCMIEEVYNLDAIKKLSFKNDDIWLKMMQLLSGTKVVRVNVKKNKKIEILSTQKVALYKTNVGKHQNDLFIDNILKEYKIDLKEYVECK